MSHPRTDIETGYERRAYCANYRATSSDGKNTIGGLASVFNQYTDMGWFLEIVLPGFFDGMDFTQAACLKNHDPNRILGRVGNDTLKLTVLPAGLDYEATLPNSTEAKDAYEEISNGYITHSSFAFTVKETAWVEMSRDQLKGIVPDDVLDKVSYGGIVDIRQLVKGRKLYDVAPVTFPAYMGTDVGARSKDALEREKQAFLTRASGDTIDNLQYRLRAAIAQGVYYNTLAHV